MEDLFRAGLLESWQAELHELLANLNSSDRRQPESSHVKKYHFQLQNCIDVSQETGRISFMALKSSVIINIPIVASVVATAPFNKESSYFEVEVLSFGQDVSGAKLSTVIIGAVQKGFPACTEPGAIEQSVGYHAAQNAVREDGSEVQSAHPDANFKVGDKIGCGLETQDDELQYIYFTKNGARVYETPLDPTVEWYPAISISSRNEEVRALQEAPWRSKRPQTDPHEGLSLNKENGHLSYRPPKPTTPNGRSQSLMLAGQPFSRQFCFFEIEIIAMNETDEIAIGAVPEDYPPRLPGFRQRSCGFHARSGGIYAGSKKKSDRAPKCQVGDKMGCGIDYKSDGSRTIYFTHNSKSFMEAQVNDNCPQRMFPAVGMRSKGTGTVCVCILDPSNWLATGDDPFGKHIQVDMTSTVEEKLDVVVVDKETARASYTAPVDVARDAVLLADTTLTPEQQYFEIEILYGSLMTLGLVVYRGEEETKERVTKHPGFMDESVGYNAETGSVYLNGEAVKEVGKSTYGDRVRIGVRKDADGKQLVYFRKNGNILCELPFEAVQLTQLCPAIGMRSAGQILAVRLLDRKMWSCAVPEAKPEGSTTSSALQQMVDRELIECPICRDVFTDPRILPCSIHTFCAGCIQAYISQYGSRRSIPCPVCRSMFTVPPGGVNDFPVNTIILRLLEFRNKLPTAASAEPNAVASA